MTDTRQQDTSSEYLLYLRLFQRIHTGLGLRQYSGLFPSQLACLLVCFVYFTSSCDQIGIMYQSKTKKSFPKAKSLVRMLKRHVQAAQFVTRPWVPFPESPDNFSGVESYFMSVKFTLKIPILLVFKAKN